MIEFKLYMRGSYVYYVSDLICVYYDLITDEYWLSVYRNDGSDCYVIRGFDEIDIGSLPENVRELFMDPLFEISCMRGSGVMKNGL